MLCVSVSQIRKITLCVFFLADLSLSGGGSGRSGIGGDGGDGGGSDGGSPKGFKIIPFLLNEWESRASVDPKFTNKVAIELFVGLFVWLSCDLAARPGFGLKELDLAVPTLLSGSLLNFCVTCLLAPASAATALPAAIAGCPWDWSVHRLVAQGAMLASLGFVAGLVGLGISKGSVAARKWLNPAFKTPSNPPSIWLSSFTWALHMGLSTNIRYRFLSLLEFSLEKWCSPMAFVTLMCLLRLVNQIAGGFTFMMMARKMGWNRMF